MSLLKRGYLAIEGSNGEGLKQGDRLYYSFKTDYDLSDGGTTRHLAMHIKSQPKGPAILKFSTEDGSILKEDVGDGMWEITLVKTSIEMKALRKGIYIFDIETYTTDEDTVTFIDGHIKIESEITTREE